MWRAVSATKSPSSIRTAHSPMTACRRAAIRFANALHELGVEHEQRVALLLNDTVDYPVAFWGTIRAGSVAVPLNTYLTATAIRLYPRRLPRDRAGRRGAARADNLAGARQAAAAEDRYHRRRHPRHGRISRPRTVHAFDDIIADADARARSPPTLCPTKSHSGCTPPARPATPRASSTSTPT